MTLTQLNTLIEGIATDVSGINRYFYGPISDENLNDSEDYPALIQLIDSYSIIGALGQERPQWPVNLYIVDQIYNDPDEATWKAKYEELAGYIEQVYMKLRTAGTGTSYGFILSDADIQPVLHWENATGVVGWLLSVTIQDEDIIDCEPFTGSSLCFEISDATWVQIKACMSAAQLADAEADIGGVGGDVTLNVNGSLFTTITAPDTFDLPVIQDGSPVGSKVGDNWVVPSCPEYDLSISQAPLTVAVDADKTLSIIDENLAAFADSVVSALEVGDTISIQLTNQTIQFIHSAGTTSDTFARSVSTIAITLFGDGANMQAPSALETSDGEYILTFPETAIKTRGNVTADTFLPEWLGSNYTILIEDQAGNSITPDSSDGSVANQVTITLPGIVSEFSADDTTPTVGETVTFTDASTGSSSPDMWLWDLGDGTFSLLQNPTNTYLIPGLKTIHLSAFIEGSDIQTIVECKQDYLTVAGIFDTYSDIVMAWAPFLLYRTYAGDCLRVRRDSDNTTQDIGFVDGELDTTSLLSFVGAGSGYCVRLYMQDGSGRYFEQTTNSRQPRIVNSGALEVDQSRNFALYFDGNDDIMRMTDFSYWSVDRSKAWIMTAFDRVVSPFSGTNIALAHFDFGTNQSSWQQGYIDSDDTLFNRYTTNGNVSTGAQRAKHDTTETGLFVYDSQYDLDQTVNDRILAWRNDTSMTLDSVVGNQSGNIFDSSADISLGGQLDSGAPSGNFNGHISAFAMAPTDQSANRSTIVQYFMQMLNLT